MTHYTNRDLQERLSVEVPIFDQLAEIKLKNFEKGATEVLGGASDTNAAQLWKDTFPNPVSIWIDDSASADAQFLAYSHLTPIAGQVVMQFGGSGSHAIKFLLAGAQEAILLSPSDGELSLAKALANRCGVADRLMTLKGVGEEIPLQDNRIDRLYGGACLHHTDIKRSLPEIHRILRSGGRAAFVEPIETPLYNLWVNKLKGTRFLKHGHDEIEDRPFTISMIREYTRLFSDVKTIKSGGFLRYSLVPIQRSMPHVPMPVQWTYTGLKLERKILSSIGLKQFFGTVVIQLIK